MLDESPKLELDVKRITAALDRQVINSTGLLKHFSQLSQAQVSHRSAVKLNNRIANPQPRIRCRGILENSFYPEYPEGRPLRHQGDPAHVVVVRLVEIVVRLKDHSEARIVE